MEKEQTGKEDLWTDIEGTIKELELESSSPSVRRKVRILRLLFKEYNNQIMNSLQNVKEKKKIWG